MLTSHPHLRALLALAALYLVGLGVREWRAGFPDAALRLDRFDQDAPRPATPADADGGERPAPSATAPTGPESASAPADESRPPGPGGDAGSGRPTDALRVAADQRPLDLNRASVAELARLPGVGPGLARRILEDRDRRGRFESPEALGRIVGLGPKKLAALRELVTVGD